MIFGVDFGVLEEGQNGQNRQNDDFWVPCTKHPLYTKNTLFTFWPLGVTKNAHLCIFAYLRKWRFLRFWGHFEGFLRVLRSGFWGPKWPKWTILRSFTLPFENAYFRPVLSVHVQVVGGPKMAKIGQNRKNRVQKWVLGSISRSKIDENRQNDEFLIIFSCFLRFLQMCKSAPRFAHGVRFEMGAHRVFEILGFLIPPYLIRKKSFSTILKLISTCDFSHAVFLPRNFSLPNGDWSSSKMSKKWKWKKSFFPFGFLTGFCDFCLFCQILTKNSRFLGFENGHFGLRGSWGALFRVVDLGSQKGYIGQDPQFDGLQLQSALRPSSSKTEANLTTFSSFSKNGKKHENSGFWPLFELFLCCTAISLL
mgnify:CR=1 FL=1